MSRFDLYKSVVRLTHTWQGRVSQGSGILFGPGGFILTNNHVIANSDTGTAFGTLTADKIEGLDQEPTGGMDAEVVIRNEASDLAVVRLKEGAPECFVDILNAPAIDDSAMERRIRVIGYPGLGGGTITVTRGIVSGFDAVRNLKTDAEVNPGNSGGAAFDAMGNFLGIPSFTVSEGSGKLGFIITIDTVRQWFEAILKNGIPSSSSQIAGAFSSSNLKFSKENVDQGSGNPRALLKLATVETLLRGKEYEKAMPHLEYLVRELPRSALVYHYFGNVFLGLGQYDKAAGFYRVALGYNPTYVPALGNLGAALMHLLRHADALPIFERIIDATDSAAELWVAYHNMGRIYEIWKSDALAEPYKAKAAQLRAVSETNFDVKTPRPLLLHALVEAEIKFGGDIS